MANLKKTKPIPYSIQVSIVPTHRAFEPNGNNEEHDNEKKTFGTEHPLLTFGNSGLKSR